MQMVAFIDILGTKKLTMTGVFNDYRSIQFSNPVAYIAAEHSELQCAVFSDSVILSTNEENYAELLKALAYLYNMWIHGWVLARGAISFGEIVWVAQEHDEAVKPLPNYSCARVYGRALVEAVEHEKKCGPGAVAFLTDSATAFLAKRHPSYVLSGAVNVLSLYSKTFLNALMPVVDSWIEEWSDDPESIRQLRATKHYFEEMLRQGKHHGEYQEFEAIPELKSHVEAVRTRQRTD